MLKRRIFIAVCILVLLLLALLIAAVAQAKKLHRDPVVLMNKYYNFKDGHPEAAKKALLIILKQDKNNLAALQEYSQWMLNDHDPQKALITLEQLHERFPQDSTYTYQLGYLYYQNGDWEKSRTLLIGLATNAPATLKDRVFQSINAMSSYLPAFQSQANIEKKPQPVAIVSTIKKPKDKKTQLNDLLNKYYSLKKKNPIAAQRAIMLAINTQPENVQSLKEAGYFALANGHKIEAIDYFIRAYDLSYQPTIAMQLGYWLDQVGDKPTAYQYFKLAAQSPDQKLALAAENSLTNLAGQQTKALPRPYFSEVYFNPFTQSRFGLTVVPFIWRFGIEQDNRFHSKEYLFFRRTQDNRSANLGEISQIYEDNVQITGVGGQITPFKKLPVVGFLEVGEAYDLVYRDRNRWRGDVRGGFMYYQEFGIRPAYYDQLKISHDYYNDWYGDVTYFSRYNNNVIGLARTHHGIHLLQYKSSIVNLYATGRVIADTQRAFYNNIAEIGGGVAFIPSNRFNLQLRFEHVNGTYLPVGGSVNPYGKYYGNNIAQLLFYVKI
jgi:Flp pilus assembly protein TadD